MVNILIIHFLALVSGSVKHILDIQGELHNKFFYFKKAYELVLRVLNPSVSQRKGGSVFSERKEHARNHGRTMIMFQNL